MDFDNGSLSLGPIALEIHRREEEEEEKEAGYR